MLSYLLFLLSHLPNVGPAGRTSTPPHTTHSPPNIIIIQHSPAPCGKSFFSHVLHGYDSNGDHDGNGGDGDGVEAADDDDDDDDGHSGDDKDNNYNHDKDNYCIASVS